MVSTFTKALVAGGLIIAGYLLIFQKPLDKSAQPAPVDVSNLPLSGVLSKQQFEELPKRNIFVDAWNNWVASQQGQATQSFTAPVTTSPQVQASTLAAIMGGGQVHQLAAANLAKSSSFSPSVAAQFSTAGLISGVPKATPTQASISGLIASIASSGKMPTPTQERGLANQGIFYSAGSNVPYKYAYQGGKIVQVPVR